MTEYIDKDALLKDLNDRYNYALTEYCWNDDYIMGFDRAVDIVRKALQLNVAIVKHGWWIDSGISATFKECSKCGFVAQACYAGNYCTNCGSKMYYANEEVGEL